MIFAGSASPRLTAAICRELGVEVGANEVIRFSEGALFLRVLENVRGRSVYLVQSTGNGAGLSMEPDDGVVA